MGRIQKSDNMPDGAIPVLDHGFVAVTDTLGSDKTVVNSARVSFGKKVDVFDEDKDGGLVRFLAKHNHMSPFRHCVVQLHIKAPELVMRQWYKHVIGCEWTSGEARFADHAWNEISGRYIKYGEEFYTPLEFRAQSSDNKQASIAGDIGETRLEYALDDETLGSTESGTVREVYEGALDQVYRAYSALIEAGLSKEQARGLLPVSFYTEVYWTASLQAIANFIKLRDHAGAQSEIKEFSDAVRSLVEPLYPVSFAALMA